MAASKAQLAHLKRLNEKRKQDSINNFQNFVSEKDSADCMNFVGNTNKGYGSYHITLEDGSEVKGAHRVAYYLANYKIDPNLNVNHSCDNKLCCNPDHLWQGTQKENMQDMVEKGRHVGHSGRKHSEEAKAKISKAVTGSRNGFYGRKHSAETKMKMRKNHWSRKDKGEDNLS